MVVHLRLFVKMTLDESTLDLAQLALFVGMAADERVLAHLERKGYAGLRRSHGFVVQHLLGGARSIGELAKLLGVTQQAASKTVAEMARIGFVEDVAGGADQRVRRVALSARGIACVEETRTERKRMEASIARAVGARGVDEARKVLIAALDKLGGLEAVRGRRVRPPRD
jgi:DNA-binding MarR family transcriptional regulator